MTFKGKLQNIESASAPTTRTPGATELIYRRLFEAAASHRRAKVGGTTFPVGLHPMASASSSRNTPGHEK